jgi:hypothetical protein
MKKGLAIGIISFFLLLALAPMTLGLNVDKSYLIKSGIINFSIYNLPEYVMVNESDDCWINQSEIITVTVYEESGNYSMNATIVITGCGLNISIDERYAVEEGYWVEDGGYNIGISPKYGGILTIMVINMTYNLNTSKDFIINGLTGSAKTSQGEDKVIIIGRNEKIIFHVSYGQCADVHLTWVDELWTDSKCINKTIGDNTCGNGLDGVFELTPNVHDLDYVGYIVVVAEAGSLYVWDLIEVRVCYIPPPEIFGPKSGKVGVKYDYHFIIPNVTYCDDIRLRVDWEDTGPGKWSGPYEPGENVTLNYRWQKEGDYKIMAQVQDVFGTMSEWGTFEVTIPRARASMSSLFLSFVERFPIIQIF